MRRTVQYVRSGASNVTIDGYGALRRIRTYKPRRHRSSPVSAFQSVVPPNAADNPMSGLGGWQGGPNIFALRSPLAASDWSRISSAERRTRGPRANNRL